MDHVEQIINIFPRIRKAGLKIKANKWSFLLKEIPYLGYVITREGVKTDPNKIQGIMNLQRHKKTTNCRNIIGMVQYYRDMCKRRSHVLETIMKASIGKKGNKI